MSDTYLDFIQALQPPPLQRKPRYLAFLASFGQRLDTDKGRLIEAIRVGLVDAAPVDALDLLGQERLLPRFPSHDNDTYRAYLREAFAIWAKSGTKQGLLDAFNAAFPGPTWACKEFKFFPTDPLWNGSTFWSQFLMEADPAAPIETWQIGEEPTGSGYVIGQPGLTIGSSLTTEQVALFRQLLAQWKAAYSTAAGIRLVMATATVVILENAQ